MSEIKVLVTGDRWWTKWEPIVKTLETLPKVLGVLPEEILIIHGDCRGADRMAGIVAKELGMKVDENPAHWNHTEKCPRGCSEVVGKAAGALRNGLMILKHPDIHLGIAFHVRIEKSRGTANMVARLEDHGVEVLIVTK